MTQSDFNTYVNKIKRFYHRERRMPTMRQIAELCGFNSTNAAKKLADKLVDHGVAERTASGRLIPKDINFSFPLMGYVQAGKTIGFPNPAEEETFDTIGLDELLPLGMNNVHIFKVSGESMINAGIHPGDVLLVELTDKYKPGQIVVALVDNELTVKYLRRDRQGVYYLESANDEIPDIYPEEELEIQGIVRRTIKFYE